MTRRIIQIYGIRSVADARMVVGLGTNHIGVSFGHIKRTPGQLSCGEAIEIFAGVQPEAVRVGLTVCEDLGELFHDLDAVRDCLPDVLHLSGEIDGYSPAEVAQIRERYPALEIMQALPVFQGVPLAEQPVLDYVRDYEAVTDFFLIDTKKRGSTDIGATGMTHSWEIDRAIVESTAVRCIIAGGLDHTNVAEALGVSRPYGADSYSLTNYDAGRGGPDRVKDPDKVAAFVAAVRSADD